VNVVTVNYQKMVSVGIVIMRRMNNMLLNNTEQGKIQTKAVKILDELINITCDGDISDEERASKYDGLVEEVVYLVEEIVDNHKSHIFVKHIENHLKEMSTEEKRHGKPMCKICCKDIDEIFKL